MCNQFSFASNYVLHCLSTLHHSEPPYCYQFYDLFVYFFYFLCISAIFLLLRSLGGQFDFDEVVQDFPSPRTGAYPSRIRSYFIFCLIMMRDLFLYLCFSVDSLFLSLSLSDNSVIDQLIFMAYCVQCFIPRSHFPFLYLPKQHTIFPLFVPPFSLSLSLSLPHPTPTLDTHLGSSPSRWESSVNSVGSIGSIIRYSTVRMQIDDPSQYCAYEYFTS